MSALIASTSSATYYASWSFWNTPIPTDVTVDPNSATMTAAALVPYAGSANFANTTGWGISVVNAKSSDPTYTLSNPEYYNNGPITVQIPAGAQPSTGSDHHIVVLNGSQELDMWNATYNTGSNTWSAGSYFLVNPSGWGAAAAPGSTAGSAEASGFSELGGIVTPQQIASGSINHALSLMIPLTLANKITGAATETDGRTSQTGAIPEGAHIQLDPSFNVAAQNWPTWEKEIAVALQKYGAYVSDTGGSLAFYGENDLNAGATPWSSVGTPEGGSLASLPWSNMRVLTMTTAPTVTAVVATAGSSNLTAGQAVTIKLTISKDVQVTGMPTLSLNDGGTANYLSGSGTSSLVFQYIVAAGQSTSALAVTAVNVPNGSEVTDSAGNATDFTKVIVQLPGTLQVSGGTGPLPPPVPTPDPDTLTLNISEDAYRGDAEFLVKMNGNQVGGTMTANALHSSGDGEVFQLTGTWGSGVQNVQIQFVNDAYGGSPSLDRNLFVNSIAYNGTTDANTGATLSSNGTASFSVGGSTLTTSTPADTLTLHLSADAYQGNAQFVMTLDGKTITTPQSVTTLHSSGKTEGFTFTGNFGAGSHTVGITFTNDAYGGSPSLDRNLYASGVTVNGQNYGSGTTELYSTGNTAAYTFTTIH